MNRIWGLFLISFFEMNIVCCLKFVRMFLSNGFDSLNKKTLCHQMVYVSFTDFKNFVFLISFYHFEMKDEKPLKCYELHDTKNAR